MKGSGGGAAAVDGVGGAGDVARLIGGEERDDGGDFGGLSEPPRRNPVDDLLDAAAARCRRCGPAGSSQSIRLSIMPGQTQLTRTPVPVHSQAALLVSPITACLLAL